MSSIQMVAGGKYSLKVVNIVKTQKQVKKKDQHLYRRYDITLQDKDGNKVECEYLSFEDDQDKFHLNAFQYIKCYILSPKGTPEIEPVEDVEVEYQDLPSGKKEDPNVAKHNQYSLNVGGTSLLFALGFAKDLLCAEVKTRPPGSKIEKEDIQRMLDWADVINDNIYDKVTF